MDIAVVVLLLLFASFVAVGVVATVRTVRAVKRGVERGSAQARRVVEDTALKARRYTLGSAGELAQLRLSLRTSIDSTYRALDAGSAEDASLSEAAALLARLNDHARVLDTELKVLEREPDKGRIADRLPSLAERTERITHSADALRWAAQDRARQFADDDLTSLAQQIDIEAGALRHWAPSTLPTGDSSGDPSGGPVGGKKRISRS
ncbi:hypothetical protein [Streptomyces sp. H39-S7]|uniref:hypothetical protein n=1 Tax=Streptomyces sp. H39-S7 TaxID=3004357 RepID=UPI0022AF9F4C|nr:hypothetical protein [Streptomyces sp. H39-S7]MCZ4124123.1 hypothetical protein [Streptomyces sp. H39-S7]